jgi:hypothetical protein
MKVYVQEGVKAVVHNRATDTTIPLAPGMWFDSDDPGVRDYPWAFESPVEQATAGPGEKRTVRRA